MDAQNSDDEKCKSKLERFGAVLFLFAGLVAGIAWAAWGSLTMDFLEQTQKAASSPYADMRYERAAEAAAGAANALIVATSSTAVFTIGLLFFCTGCLVSSNNRVALELRRSRPASRFSASEAADAAQELARAGTLSRR